MPDLERIKPAIARVHAKGDGIEKTGTAFFIGGKYALTALHVIADTATGTPAFLTSISLQFPHSSAPVAASVVEGLCSAAGDWAVLECEPPPDAVAFELGGEPAQGAEWITYGFPTIQPGGMTMSGTVSDPRLLPLPASTQLPQHPVLQLYGREASAGNGAPMHGFSGAPCVVGGKAVGILRSTLIEEVIDGQAQRLLYTQAGTLYATPTRSVVDWQADRRGARLPDSWAPPEITMRDFVVLLSASEPDPKSEANTPQQVALRGVAKNASKNLKERNPKERDLGEPYFLAAAEAVSSEQSLEECVRALCNARVVVFDATGFEPAIMFLAGIRAVVRRGVTLLSVGGDYALGKQLAIPFNITDANIVAHSREQNRSMIANSATLLTTRIDRGLDALRSPLYLDLPVYDAIRRLPTDRRGIIPSSDGVLVLCPFDEAYASFWTENLKQALSGELTRMRQKHKLTEPASYGVSRSFELNSPRLVTHAVYEAIRRFQSCVIDLSGWSPNVLFELGVRLAASGERTACIIENGWERKLQNQHKDWLPQCQRLASHFISADFTYNIAQSYEGQSVFSNAYGPDALALASPLLGGGLHKLVERALDVSSEPASRSVVLDLQDQAATFSRDPGSGGRSKPVGLFPGNPELVRREEAAEFECLLAAWYYASNRYAQEEILSQAAIRNAVYDVTQALFERHAERLTDQVKSAAGQMMDEIENWRDDHGRSTAE